MATRKKPTAKRRPRKAGPLTACARSLGSKGGKTTAKKRKAKAARSKAKAAPRKAKPTKPRQLSLL